MALLYCPECGRQISDQALTCPQCGYPVSEHRDDRFALVLLHTASEGDAAAALRKAFAQLGIRADLSENEARHIVSQAPAVLLEDLSFQEVFSLYRQLKDYGQFKLVRMNDLTDCSPEGLTRAPAAALGGPSAKPDHPLTFPKLVGAVVVGMLCWTILSLFLYPILGIR